MHKILTTITATLLLCAASFASAQDIAAVVSADKIAVLSSQRGGLIKDMPIALGQQVRVGDVLVALECAAQTAELAAADAELEIADIEVRSQRRLVAGGAGGQAALSQAFARSKLKTARRDIARAYVAQCSVRAPFDGVISDVTARAHENVQAGAPLFEIVDTTSLQLEIIVPAAWRADLNTGTPLVFLDAATQVGHGARITTVAPKIDGVSQTLRIIAKFDQIPSNLVPGSSGSVRRE